MFIGCDFFPAGCLWLGQAILKTILKFGHGGKHLWQKKRLFAWSGHNVTGQNKPVQRIEAVEARHRPQHIDAQQEPDVQAGGVMVAATSFFDLNSPNSDRYIELWLNMFISWGGVKLFGSQVSPSKTLPHLGRAMTDIQELKQVPSLSLEEPLLVSLLMRVCRLPFHLLLMFPTSWCSFLIGSRGYGSAWLRWPMAQTLCDELLQPFHPLEIRWDPLVLPC